MIAEDSIVDDIARHNPGDVGFDRAALPPALFLAWCVSLNEVSRSFLESAGSQATRLKMRDISPADAFVSICGGELGAAQLSEPARRFAHSHYDQYLEELQSILAEQDSASIDGWAIYDEISPWLTRCWFDQRGGSSAESGGVLSKVASWWASR